MRLTEAQQERYARHLLLEGLGGEGQERLLAACVRIRGTGRAARWAARYLAASGIGTLLLDDPLVAAECRDLSPDLRVLFDRDRDRDREPNLDLDFDQTINAENAEIAEGRKEENPSAFSAFSALRMKDRFDRDPATAGALVALRAVRRLSLP